MNTLLNEITLTAIALLAIVILVQQRQIRFLQQRRQRQVPIEQKIQPESFALLHHFPEPLLLINQSGRVLFRNESWEALPGPYDHLATIQQLDTLLGTTLEEKLRIHPDVARFELHLRIHSRISDELERIPYFAIAWPIHSREVVFGRAIIFFPQRLSKQRQQRYPLLEQHLIEYLLGSSQVIRKLSQQAQKLSEHARQENLSAIEDQSVLMTELANLVKEVHTPLRQTHQHESVIIAEHLRQVAREARSELKQHGAQLIQTISSKHTVRAHPEDLQLLLRMIFESILTDIQSHSTLRIDATADTTTLTCSLTYPHIRQKSDSLYAMRHTLIEQLAIKMNATVSLNNHADHEHIYRLHFPIR